MKKIVLSLMAIVMSAVGYAQTENYKIHVGQFDKLRVLDNVNVVYRCHTDSTGWAQFSGAKEFADAFILTPNKGELKIQVSTEDVDNPQLPVLYVYSDFLTYVENSSLKTVTVEHPAPCAQFTAKEIGNGTITVSDIHANVVKGILATGNGSINISGRCETAELKMIGTGLLSMDRLETTEVKCSILGSGSIGCWPTEKLKVTGIGSTKIYYKGDPVIKKSGGGKLFPLPAGETIESYKDDNGE